jgi:hypothetical protein
MVWRERPARLTLPIPSVSVPKLVKNGFYSSVALFAPDMDLSDGQLWRVEE